ncbi:alpha-1A adrenergic receptor-like [Pollicipes pollicipes]|uniref:alpha-1A adrenergic receptor-like n=1 Tax=Pollicipes pollicipes TaxID=41117 RepID=UPI0018859697|nr:alpha-1A adrenergic receptor-like [Pollicipes pollicipes]
MSTALAGEPPPPPPPPPLVADGLNGSLAEVAAAEASAPQLCAAVAKSLLLGLVVALTICGNTLVLLALVRTRTLRGSTAYLIGSLAVADLLLGVAVLPFSAVLEVSGRWYFGAAFCSVWAAADVLCCTASILSLCVISVDRYIGVTRPLGHAAIMSGSRTMAINVLVWLLSLAISIGPLIGWKGPPAAGDGRCSVNTQVGYVLFSVIGSFYFPMLVILAVYWRIYRAVVRETRCWESGVKVTDSQVALRVHRGGARGADPAGERSRRPSGDSTKLSKFRRQTKAAKTLGIVVGVFLLCWFPFFFVLPLSALCSMCYIPEPLFAFFFWLGYCNSCLNPFIYVCTSREFKRAFTQILCGGARRRRPPPLPCPTIAFHEAGRTLNGAQGRSQGRPQSQPKAADRGSESGDDGQRKTRPSVTDHQ